MPSVGYEARLAELETAALAQSAARGHIVSSAMPSIRVALAIFVVGSTIVVFLAYLGYRSHVDYCEGSPEVAAGGDELSCLEPQHWFAALIALSVLALVELALAVVVGAAVVHARSKQRAPAGERQTR